MDAILKAIRDTLVADVTLTALVPAADITASYNAEVANYPCVVLGVLGGGSLTEIAGVTSATIVIDLYSAVDKQEVWTIYDRIKTLLHDQARAVTNGSVLVHAIYESRVDDNQFVLSTETWRLTARYEVIFSTTSVIAIAIEDGKIYAHASAVAVDAAKEIASFHGMLSLDMAFLSRENNEQERFAKTAYYHTGIAYIDIENVTFNPASLNLLWGVTYGASETLNDGSTAATKYTITQATTPSFLQFLFHGTQTSDGKKIEVEALKAVVESLRIPFSKSRLSEHRCRWHCFGDSSDDVVSLAIEN